MLKTLLRSGGYFLAAVAFLILFYASIVFAGWYIGRINAAEAIERELVVETERQLELAQEDLANNNIAMAANRLEFLQEKLPNDAQVIALALAIENESANETVTESDVVEPTRELPSPVIIRTAEDVTATATTLPATPIPTPRNTPTPRPTPTSRPTPRPEQYEQQLSSIEAAIDEEQWEDAIAELVAFQLSNPSYERFYTDSLLFDAYVGGGFAFTNSNRVTLGINYFEQAEKLGTLPEDAVSQLYYSRVYLTAMSYYGIDWPRSVNRLDEICRLAPGFQNACDLLFNARTAWGDQFATANDDCAAAEQYRLALTLSNSSSVSQKFNTTDWKCKNATPTPWGGGG